MDEERRAAILRAWTELGRPGARKVAVYMRKRGDDVSEKLVNQVLNRKTAQQVFRSQWKSEGHITATVRNDTWQADIMSFRTAADGYRYAYVFVDVWSREVVATPARLKTPRMSIEAFHRAQIRLGWPKIMHMDGGGEWRGEFQAYMRQHGVQLVTRDQEHRNGLGIVDSAISRLRRAISKEQIDEGGGDWVAPLLRAVEGLNRRENRHLLGESPYEVRANNPTTAFALDIQAGRQILAQTRMLAALKDRLRRAGRFRVQVPDDERTKKSANPTFSGRIHEVRSIDQATVTDERGNVFRIWLVLPVDGGDSIVFPRAVRPNEDDHRREELEAFAAALKARIGDGRMGALAAAAFLRTVPGFRGSVPELLRLFPEEFQVDGRGNDIIISVRS